MALHAGRIRVNRSMAGRIAGRDPTRPSSDKKRLLAGLNEICALLIPVRLANPGGLGWDFRLMLFASRPRSAVLGCVLT